MVKHILVLAFVLFAVPSSAQISREALEKVQASIDAALSERIVSAKTADELATALKSGSDGLIIEAEPGAVYRGAFVAPNLPAGARAILRVRGVLPDQRVTPADSWRLFTLRAPAGSVPLTVGSGWTVDGFKLEAEGNAYGLLRCGSADGYASAADIPQHVEFRRFLIDVPPDQQERRGVMTHCGSLTIRQCWIAGVKEAGADAQAIAGWDFPGPLTVEDCRLEASGEVIIIGGADPSIKGMTPSDLQFLNNTITRPMSWRGGPWTVKNLLELKHARRVVVRGNVFSNNWAHAQTGFAFLLTPRNQNGGCPWCVVEDVLWERNISTNIASAFNILGSDDVFPSMSTRGIVIRNNLTLVDGPGLDGDGRCYQLLDGRLSDVTIDHDTCIATGTFLNLDTFGKGKMRGIAVTNSIGKHNLYGVFGSNVGSGLPAFEAMLEAPVFLKNVLAGATQAGYVYPATTISPTMTEFNAQFTPDWSLVSSSAWKNAGTDGRDLGASLTASVPPPPVDPCVVKPLKVTVTAWPRGNGNGRKSGTWDDGGFDLVKAAFMTAPQRFEATDTRGCSVTVYR